MRKSDRFLMKAEWPQHEADHFDADIETQFSEFQQVIAAIRQIRASQNIAPKEKLPVSICTTADAAKRMEPMRASIERLAGAVVSTIGPDATAFEVDAPLAISAIEMEVHVDIAQFIDLDAELGRLNKLLDQLVKQISGKQNKLNNESFVSRAPAEIVAKERESLDDLKQQHIKVQSDIEKLKEKS